MKGPFKLTSSNIGKRVENRTGVYKLYNSREGPVRYIGMSTDLKDRLRDHCGDYSYFEYEYQPNRTEAYKREVRIYHYHGGKKGLNNDNHPPRPHQRVTCPKCSIHD